MKYRRRLYLKEEFLSNSICAFTRRMARVRLSKLNAGYHMLALQLEEASVFLKI